MLLRPLLVLLFAAALLLHAGRATAAELPQDHEYQQQLRAYLATLTEQDFAIELKPFTVSPGEKTAEELYRFRVLHSFPAPFQRALRQPAALFTLDAIEGEESILMPGLSTIVVQSWTYNAAWLAMWDYPGNPYFNDRALKLRTFACAAVDMVMHDHAHEKQGVGKRSDYLGGTLIWLAYAYQAARDILPPEVKAAYETGLVKFMHRLNEWGPTGAMTDMDLFAAVSMPMVAELLQDPELARLAEAYVQRLYSDPRFFHPAGYFVDNGCFDTSYNGISLFFTAWAAMKHPHLAFIGEALNQSYKLRAHLSFPDPDGRAFGPSSMSSRTSAGPPMDQWNFPIRDIAAGMLTDHALYLTSVPAPEQLRGAEEQLIAGFNNAITGDYTPGEPQVWQEAHWGPRPNHAYDHFVPGYYDRRLKLAAEDSPLLRNPYLREGDFLETFEKVFLTGKVGGYGFAVHTGPVGRGIHGFGGGALVAFWTPETGSVMLGRRRGWAAQTGRPEVSDSWDIWRMWPVHAVTGLTADGNVFSSSRLVDPNPVYTVGDRQAEVAVSGVIPQVPTNTASPSLQGEVKYARRFTLDEAGLTVETAIESDGKDQVTELYETLPVFLREAGWQAKAEPTAIHFQVDGQWQEATPEFQEGVSAVKLSRFDGAVLVTFRGRQRVKLSPEVWSDHYQTRANCRTVLIDLLDGSGAVQAIPAVTLSYTIAPLKD